MENYIMLNGKKIPLTEEQIKLIQEDVPEKSPFDRADEGETYYYINHLFDIYNDSEFHYEDDDDCYRCANYCTDENIMKQHALHMLLNNLLWRYSMTHGGDKISFERSTKQCIGYDNDTKGFYLYDSVFSKFLGTVYFIDAKTARDAIEEIVKPFIEANPEFDVTKM